MTLIDEIHKVEEKYGSLSDTPESAMTGIRKIVATFSNDAQPKELRKLKKEIINDTIESLDTTDMTTREVTNCINEKINEYSGIRTLDNKNTAKMLQLRGLPYRKRGQKA